jgi:4-hydroxy-tetrahydrodipicolinate synthase
MKDTCRRIDPFSAKVKAAAGSNLKLYQANLAVLPPSMDAGGAGFCGWLPIVSPELCAQVCDLSLSAELRKLAHDKLVAFNEVMVAHGFPASAKHILSLRDLPIQPYSRARAAGKFFEIDPSALEGYIAREQPFVPAMLTTQP